MTANLKFDYETRCYGFRGKPLLQPAPGTYDATKWTPPSHLFVRVDIQNDGLFVIYVNGVETCSGDGAKQTRIEAKSLIEKHCARLI